MTPDDKLSKTQLFVGILQFLTAIALIGYIWSWYWSYLLIGKSFELGEFANKTPAYAGAGGNYAGAGGAAVSNLGGRNQRSYQQFADEGAAEADFLNGQR